MLVDLVDRGRVDERADVGRLVEAVAELEGLDARRERRDETVVYAGLHIDAVGGDATLPAIAELGDHRGLDRGVEIGVVEDDERGIAAELQAEALDGARRCLHQPRRRCWLTR